MGKALVDVLVDDVRFVEDQVALDQHRQPVVRVHHRDVFRLVVHVHVDDLKVHALFVQHDAAALRERAGGSGVEIHHVCLPCCRIRIDVKKKNARAPSAPRLWAGFSSAHVFPELPVKEVGEHEQHQKNQHHHVANLLAGELVGLGHPGHEIDQIADQDVVVDLGERSRRFGPDRLEYEALPRSTTTSWRSEEHTSELQSRLHLVCRLLLEKKKKKNNSR